MPSPRTGLVHHLYYSRWRAWLILVVGVPFGLYSIAGVYAVSVVVGDVALLGIPILVAAYCYLVYRAVHRIRHTEPVVSLDQFGILDRRQRNATIPWTSIRALYIGPYGSSTSLLIAFRSTEVMEQALGRTVFLGNPLMKAANFINAPGAQWGIQLGPLRCRTSEVLKLAKRLHAAATQSSSRPSPTEKR
jgi:hypothetical protein